MKFVETKLPQALSTQRFSVVSSHQGGRSFARVTHLSCAASNSKIFSNGIQWHFSIPSLGQSRCHLAAINQRNLQKRAQETSGHRCCWLASCSKAPLSSLFFSVCTVQTHFNFRTFTCRCSSDPGMFFPLGLTSLALGLEPRKSEKMSGSWKSRSTYAVDITIHGFAHDSRGSLRFIGQMLDKFQDGGQTKLCRFCDRGSMMPFS